MSGHHHDHDHHHHDHDHSELSETQLRVRALETVLTEKGYVDPAALDLLIEAYEKKVGPRNGAQVVAKAWTDPAYRARLFKDATSAIGELGFSATVSLTEGIDRYLAWIETQGEIRDYFTAAERALRKRRVIKPAGARA